MPGSAHISAPAPFRFVPPSGGVPGAQLSIVPLRSVSVVGRESSPASASLQPIFSAASQNGDHHIQIALHLFDRCRPGWWRLPPFSKTTPARRESVRGPRAFLGAKLYTVARACRVSQRMSDEGRAAMRVQSFRADSRHRHQILHRHLGAASLAFAHLLLDCLRQQLHQCQPPRHPTGAAVEAARQFLESSSASAQPSPPAASLVPARFPAD